MDELAPTQTHRLKNDGPLQGVRILDLTSVIMGPFATQTLGDMGAEVITVETLDGGGNRTMGPGPHDEISGIALNLLRNKRSIALDLKNSKGREVVLRIAARCDALVTNLRPKPLERLGLQYPDIVKVRADIVYCQAQGFRSDTIRADDPAYDDIIQAESGVADATRRTGRDPMLAPTIMADKICGLSIVNAVTAGLFHRFRTGRGQRIEVPMSDVMKSFMLVEHGAGAISVPASGDVGWSRVLSPERGPQRTLDGWINILPYSVEAFASLFIAGGRSVIISPSWTKEDLAANATELYGELKKAVESQTTQYWLEFCGQHGIPVGQIGNLQDLVAALPTAEHPNAGTYHVIPPPIWFLGSPASVRSPAPLLGEHTKAILDEVGYTEQEIEELILARIARAPGADKYATAC